MASDELAQAVGGAGRGGGDGRSAEMPLDILGERGGRVVSAGAILVQGAHDDPVELAADEDRELARIGSSERGDAGDGLGGLCDACAWAWGIDLADDALDLAERGGPQGRGVERRGAGQELVEQHAERVHIGASVDVQRALGLFGAHVLWGADELLVLGEERSLGEAAIDRLGDAEVDHLGVGAPVLG